MRSAPTRPSLWIASSLLALAGCATPHGAAPSRPASTATAPTTRPAASKPAPPDTPALRFAVGDEKRATAVLRDLAARSLRAKPAALSKVKTRVLVSAKDRSKSYWLLAFATITPGKPEKRTSIDDSDTPPAAYFDVCHCRWNAQIDQAVVQIVALHRHGKHWTVIGRSAVGKFGHHHCALRGTATFGDRNGNKHPDVVLAVIAEDDGCRPTDKVWGRTSSLWEIGPRRLVKHLDLGQLRGSTSGPFGGVAYAVVTQGVPSTTVVIGNYVYDDPTPLDGCAGGSTYFADVADGCKKASARVLRWSAPKRRWVRVVPQVQKPW